MAEPHGEQQQYSARGAEDRGHTDSTSSQSLGPGSHSGSPLMHEIIGPGTNPIPIAAAIAASSSGAAALSTSASSIASPRVRPSPRTTAAPGMSTAARIQNSRGFYQPKLGMGTVGVPSSTGSATNSMANLPEVDGLDGIELVTVVPQSSGGSEHVSPKTATAASTTAATTTPTAMPTVAAATVLTAAATTTTTVIHGSPRQIAQASFKDDQLRPQQQQGSDRLKPILVDVVKSSSPTFVLDAESPPVTVGSRVDGIDGIPDPSVSPSPLGDEQFFEIVDFMLALTGALHKYGMPTHRLEYQVTWVAERFGINALAAVFPSNITVTFRRPNDPHTSFAYNLNVAYSWDLEKLELTDSLAMKVAKRKFSLDQGIRELRKIYDKPPRYKWWMVVLCSIVMSGSLCPLFYGGGLIEFGVAMFLGLVVGGLLLLADKALVFARLFDFLSAIIASGVAATLGQTWLFGPVHARSIMLAGMIWALPGLQINTAAADLSTRMMVSGTSRFIYALLVIFVLGFGTMLGTKFGRLFPRPGGVASSSFLTAVVPSIPLSPWLAILWTPLGACTLGMLLGACPRQFPALIVAGCCAYLQTALSPVFGTELATMISQVAVVLSGNIYARLFDRPAFIPNVIGSLMIIPSSLGVRGISEAMLSGDSASAMTFAWSMITIAVSMVVGTFLANMILFPKRAF